MGNLNPWTGSSEESALLKDYKSLSAYSMLVNEIKIVNHINGVVNKWKVWRFSQETTLLAAFTDAITTGDTVDSGGSDIPNCPIMDRDGALTFSSLQGNDGCRLGIVGGNTEDNRAYD